MSTISETVYNIDPLHKIHTCWDTTVGLPKQRQAKVDWYELLCFGNPVVQLASQQV